MDVEAIVARIWPGEEARVEVLGGGITNHNFKVEVDGGPYVLRIAGAGHRRCSGSTAPSSTRRRSRPPPSASAPRWWRSSSPRATS